MTTLVTGLSIGLLGRAAWEHDVALMVVAGAALLLTLIVTWSEAS